MGTRTEPFESSSSRSDIQLRICAQALLRQSIQIRCRIADRLRRKRQLATTAGASMAGQVSMTTSRPAALARSAAASSITPS
jgi:hypothetical protein